MSGGAIAGAAVVGAGASIYSGKKAAKSADKASNRAASSADAQTALGYEQLDFNKQQYDDWNAIFGDTQKTLASYYNTLSPEVFASTGLQNIEQEYTRSRTQLDATLAKRGISNSGVAADDFSTLEAARMMGRADVRNKAETQVRAEQMNFLAVGKGQQSQLQANISNSYGNLANSYGNQASTQYGMANNYTNQANQAYAGVGQAIGSGVNAYMMHNATSGVSNSGQTQWINPNYQGYGVYGIDYINK